MPPSKQKKGVKLIVITFLFIAILVVMLSSLWFMERLVKAKIKEVNELRTQVSVIKRSVAKARILLSGYKEVLGDIKDLPVKLPKDRLDVFSEVEKILTKNKLYVSLMSPIKSTNKYIEFEVDFKGDYYSFLRFLTDLRRIKYAVCIKKMNISSEKKTSGVSVKLVMYSLLEVAKES